MLAHFIGVFVEFLVVDDFQDLHAHAALDEATTESIEMNFFDGIHDFFSGGYSGHWEAISDSFGHCHDIRLHTVGFESPVVLPDPPKSSLHFITNTQPSMLSDQLIHPLQIPHGQRL